MKFVVSSSVLLKQLSTVNGVITNNPIVPILENFLFQLEHSQLTVTASDLQTVMITTLEVESQDTGAIAVPARLLLDTLRGLPDQPITFKVDTETFGTEIITENGRYKLSGENPIDFPKVPQVSKSLSVEIGADVLGSAIANTIFAVSSDDLRPAMTGVFFELSTTGVQFVATDAHRLVRYKRTDAKAPKTDSFIVPRKPLNLLKNALPDNEDAITISYNSNHLFVNHGSTQMICRLIDARFPDYKVVIPADNPYKLVVNKHDFQNALRRVNVFSNKSTNQVALNITGNELQMAAQDIDFSFEGNERMSCEYKGEDIQIAFNAKFLIEMLSAADTDDIFIELSTPSKAGLIKPSEQAPGEDLLMLVMPLMLNS